MEKVSTRKKRKCASAPFSMSIAFSVGMIHLISIHESDPFQNEATWEGFQTRGALTSCIFAAEEGADLHLEKRLLFA